MMRNFSQYQNEQGFTPQAHQANACAPVSDQGYTQSIQSTTNCLFLAPMEIFEMTGLQQPCAQKKWLTVNGWIFQVDARGRPKIARAFFDKKMTQYPLEAITSLVTPKGYSVNTQALRKP